MQIFVITLFLLYKSSMDALTFSILCILILLFSSISSKLKNPSCFPSFLSYIGFSPATFWISSTILEVFTWAWSILSLKIMHSSLNLFCLLKKFIYDYRFTKSILHKKIGPLRRSTQNFLNHYTIINDAQWETMLKNKILWKFRNFKKSCNLVHLYFDKT